MNKLPVILLMMTVLAGCASDDDPPAGPEDPPVVCDQDPCWDESVYACRDSKYIDLFTRDTGWTGGDATYSIGLGPGRRVWLFGDTFIDQVNPDRSRPGFRLIYNSLVLQEGNQLTTFHGGSASAPSAYAVPP